MDELSDLLPKAVDSVKGGVGAVLDCHLDANVDQKKEKGDEVLEEGAAERGGGKGVLVG